jgi:hypothetical protein
VLPPIEGMSHGSLLLAADTDNDRRRPRPVGPLVRRDLLRSNVRKEPVSVIERPIRVMKLAVVLLALLGIAGCAVAPLPATPGGIASTPATATSESSCACSTSALTSPPGGLSRDEAIAAAERLAPSAGTKPAVIWASINRNPFDLPGVSEASLVWEVRLEWSFSVSPCPSGFLDRLPSLADPACLDGDSGLIVVLDVFSGDLIGWTH